MLRRNIEMYWVNRSALLRTSIYQSPGLDELFDPEEGEFRWNSGGILLRTWNLHKTSEVGVNSEFSFLDAGDASG